MTVQVENQRVLLANTKGEEHINANESTRCVKIVSIINDLFKQHNEPKKILLLLTHEFIAIPRTYDNRIYIPRIFLLEPNDFCNELKELQDKPSLLEDDHYLERIADTSYACLDRKRASRPLTRFEKEMLRTFLKFIQDPQKSEAAKKFILGHEAAHIQKSHLTAAIIDLNKLIRRYWLSLFLAGSLAIALIFTAAIPLWIVMMSALTLWMILSIPPTLHFLKLSRKDEEEADTYAAENASIQVIQGGIYLFEILRAQQKEAYEKSFLGKLLFTSSGDNRLLSWTHPTESARIEYLQKILAAKKEEQNKTSSDTL